MADNSTFDPGTGGDTYRSKDRAGVKTEIVGIDLGIGTGSESLMSGAMPVTDNSGSLTVDNGGTFAVQDSQKIADNAGFTDGTTPINPVGYIFDEVAGTALTENDIGAARMDSKRAQVGVIEDASTRGQRASVSAGGALKVDNSAVTQPVSGTVTANAGTGPFPVSDNAGSLTVDASAATFGVNQAQVSGTAISVNSGAKDAGTQRVILASDQTVVPISDNSGSLTVDAPVGTPAFVRLSDGSAAITALPVTDNSGSLTVDAPVGTPLFATITPSTTGGWSVSSQTALSNTKTSVKASLGTFGGYMIYNPNASAVYVQVFDVASGSVTVGSTTPTYVIPLPASSAANVEFTAGINHATAIVIAATTTATGSTAPSTALTGFVLFK